MEDTEELQAREFELRNEKEDLLTRIAEIDSELAEIEQGIHDIIERYLASTSDDEIEDFDEWMAGEWIEE